MASCFTFCESPPSIVRKASALSTGQKKRLALLCAYLEDRDIVIFDEWAADQDPVFRRIFYEELLPALHAGGKTVIVISHDDRYFHCGERLVELVDGKLVNRHASRPDPAII